MKEPALSGQHHFWLTCEEIVRIHNDLVSEQEVDTQGILSPGNLMVAVQTPNLSFFGIVPYENLFQKVAKMMYDIITLHPFVDGNKRTGFQVGVVTLYTNHHEIDCPEEESVNLMVDVAKGEKGYPDLLDFLNKYSYCDPEPK